MKRALGALELQSRLHDVRHRLARWLHDQLFIKRLPHRKLMLRKALTYLSQDQRALAQGARQPS